MRDLRREKVPTKKRRNRSIYFTDQMIELIERYSGEHLSEMGNPIPMSTVVHRALTKLFKDSYPDEFDGRHMRVKINSDGLVTSLGDK